ncbi:hypothetical protein [Thermus filiformis]|uniref:OstA family protein n=1 Tax=Thermus filiformis TaxID=276 RepID=A0A0A2X9V5_THEFI|nr:hypothetical protein [Thermus filiformis]KGQ21979.2 hypothetical protein THFILI_03955 [Thermus filiformis]
MWGLLLLALLAWAQEVFRPQVELVRKDKKVVASVSGEEGSLFYGDYGDLFFGVLEEVGPEVVQVSGRRFFRDAGSRLEGKPGDRVEVAYNKDLTREGLPYLMRLRPLEGEGKEGEYLRLVLYDPKEGVLVRFGEEAEARGSLAVVERGSREELWLSGGEARYLEEEGRLEVRPAPGEVVLNQGESRAVGQTLRYENDQGLALLEGPVRLFRPGDPPLEGEAEGLEYRLDEGDLWLRKVVLRQGKRTTRAGLALVRDREGVAYLYGGVESQDEKGLVRGERVRYVLKTGDVVVLKRVSGEFRD